MAPLEITSMDYLHIARIVLETAGGLPPPISVAPLSVTPASREVPPLGPDGWPVDSIEPPPACPDCGTLVFWWNPLGTDGA